MASTVTALPVGSETMSPTERHAFLRLALHAEELGYTQRSMGKELPT